MTPRYCTPAFVQLRDEFRSAGFHLSFNRDTEVFEVRRGRALVWACPTLTGARRWFRWCEQPRQRAGQQAQR
jgi:hypothetical protein